MVPTWFPSSCEPARVRRDLDTTGGRQITAQHVITEGHTVPKPEGAHHVRRYRYHPGRNLTADPELRFTQSGVPVADFTVASTPRIFDRASGEWKDGDALFLRCTLWRQPAENVAETLTKGSRVIVTGRLRQRSYETREGEKRTVVEVDVDEIGPSLRYATARVTRAGKTTTTPAPTGGGGEHGGGDPWTGGAGGGDDQTPF